MADLNSGALRRRFGPVIGNVELSDTVVLEASQAKLIFGVDMEMESRIFSVTEYIRPSDGEPIRSVVLETKDSAVVVWHAHPGQEITA